MFYENEIDYMIDVIGMLMDDHGIRFEDGHWLTDEELLAMSPEEVTHLFKLCTEH